MFVTPSYQKGLEYLNARGLSQAVERFGLGIYTIDGQIYNMDAPHPEIIDVHRAEKFFGTILFPIKTLYGDVIGVSARRYETSNANTPKYINTIYDKSKHLFLLNYAKESCIKERHAFVVEGNVDAIKLHLNGVTNCVAMLGSAFSITQLCLLSRFVDAITFVPDGDAGGERFLKLLKNFLSYYKSEFSLKYDWLQLPKGDDPDSFLSKKNVSNFLSLPRKEIFGK